MRIPGGDLVPARRRGRYGGSYGRRRSRNRRAVLVGVLLVAVGAAGAYYLRKDDSGAPARLRTAPPCSPTATPRPTIAPPRVVALPAPQAVTLSVLNGTNRSLLAKRVGDALAAQGFRVTGQGNSRTAVAGPSQVVFGPGASLPARTAALWVPGSVVVPNAKAARGSVQVVLGSSFTRLATPAEAAAARRGPVPTPPAAPSPKATVLPCHA